jgi:hypothetical protein
VPADDPSTELQALRRRVAKLEQIAGPDGDLERVIGMAISDLRVEFEQRFADAERTRLKFMGLFEHGVVYPEGSLITYDGGLWYALEDTRQAPRDCPASWRLAVKAGRTKLVTSSESKSPRPSRPTGNR